MCHTKAAATPAVETCGRVIPIKTRRRASRKTPTSGATGPMTSPPYSALRSRKLGLRISSRVSIVVRSAAVGVHHAKDHLRSQHDSSSAAQQLPLMDPDDLPHHLVLAQHLEVVTDHDHRQTPLPMRSEEHTSELQSRLHLVCRLLLEKKKKN